MSQTAKTANEPFMCGTGRKHYPDVRYWVIFALPTMTELGALYRLACQGRQAFGQRQHWRPYLE